MSRLPQVFSRLAKGKFTGLLFASSPPHYVGGYDVSTTATPVSVSFFAIPDGPETYNVDPEIGAQITVNEHFYFEGHTTAIKDKDKLRYNDGVETRDYELRGVERRPHGDFTYAYGKFLEAMPNTDSSSGA